MRRFLIILILLLTFNITSNKALNKKSAIFEEFKDKTFKLKVESDPPHLKEYLYKRAFEKLSLCFNIVEEGGSWEIEIDFKTKNVITDIYLKGDSQWFSTINQIIKRKIFQKAKMVFTLYDSERRAILKKKAFYDGRTNYRVSDSERPEDAIEECLERILKKLKGGK